jgi:hypothetical protein
MGFVTPSLFGVSTDDSLDLYFETFVAINGTYQFMYYGKADFRAPPYIAVVLPFAYLCAWAGKDFFFPGKSR